MRYGPLLFVGLLFALALSWLGMIATPQLQFGNQQPTNIPPVNVLYPTPHPGLASLGREVYRANGCAYCHTQVVRQQGARLDVVLSKPGTNQPAVVDTLVRLRTDLNAAAAEKLLASAPVTILTPDSKKVADAAQKALSDAGADATVKVIPTGTDISRGWGTRLSVAHDYIYDNPVMLGSARIGPDLANVGVRQPDPGWHLVHLYDPRLRVAGSIMPRYPFLFEKRPRGRQPAANALPIPGDEDIIPTGEARALAAYLVSMRAEMPLFEAPAPPLPSPAAAVSTNLPAGPEGSTNVLPGATGATINIPSGTPPSNSPTPNQAAPQ